MDQRPDRRETPSVSGDHVPVSNEHGTLFVVATPVGNLGDFSARGIETLRSVDLVAVEDTRHSGRLLKHFEISTPMCSMHEHNESSRVEALLARIRSGENIALISDAGTPLISDPGYRLVKAARDAGIDVSPVPGPCAAIAALSVSGIATDRFVFEGYLPPRQAARRKRLAELAGITSTLVFYESPKRIGAMLADAADVLGDRDATLAREMTKLHESIYSATLEQLAIVAKTDADIGRGEIVLIVAGSDTKEAEVDVGELVRELIEVLPPRQASRIAAKFSGRTARELYAYAMTLKR